MKTRWQYEDGELLLGDCLDHMAAMKKGSCDLVFGSPPYSDARLYLEDGVDLGIARKTEEWVKWMIEVFRAALRVSKGLVAFVVGHGKGAKSWDGAPALLCADMIRAGINLRSPVWYRRSGIMGSSGPDWLRADMEWIVCAGPRDLSWSDNVACGHKPKYREGGEISHRDVSGKRVNQTKKAKVRRTYRTGDNGRLIHLQLPDGRMEIQSYVPPEKANPGNVIDCTVGGGHLGSKLAHESVAPFPEKLPDFFIRSFCPPGGIVYDCFGGSGTTAAMAIRNGRRFICSDIRMSQIKLMQKRIDQARGRKGFVL